MKYELVKGEDIEKALIEARFCGEFELPFLRAVLTYLSDGLPLKSALKEARELILIDNISKK